MNDSPLRQFCESKHRKLIVVIVTTLLGLLVLIPLVDTYFGNKESHNTLAEELDQTRLMAEGLPEIEKKVAEVVEKLAAIESRAVSKDSVSSYRSKVVDFVRKSGCEVRRFDVATPTRRTWLIKDDPLETVIAKGAKNKKTPFALERRNVVLLVDGTMETVRELLGQLHKDDSFAHLHRLEIHSATRGSEQVTLQLELWLFALSRQKV